MRKTLIACIGVSTLLLAGCSSSTETTNANETTPTSDELTTVTVGTLPVAVSAALLHGVDEGIFEDHGLDLQLQSGQAGTALVTAVVSGSVDVAFSSPLSVVLAHDKGLPVQIVSGFSNSNPSGEDTQAVIVRKDSDIETFADLENRTVAVNAIETQGDLSVMEAVERDGGDPSSVKFLEIPFPEMQSQLETEAVDAVWTPDPFMGRMLNAGDDFTSIGSSYQSTIPGQPTQVVFASEEFVQQHPDVVESFQAALDETLQAVEKDPNLVREQLPDFLDMEPAEAETVVLGGFDAVASREDLQQLADLMVKYGFIDDAPDLETLIVEKSE